MQTDIVFHPNKGKDPSYIRQVALISSGFFLLIQFAFLKGLPARLAFTILFASFLLLGLWISIRISRTWPQKIIMNHEGICYGELQARHRVDSVPWKEINRLDLFYNQHNMSPFLRIGLRSGAFRECVQRSRLQRWSMGLDINIPVAVDAAPEVVLQKARQLWKEAEQSHARKKNGERLI